MFGPHPLGDRQSNPSESAIGPTAAFGYHFVSSLCNDNRSHALVEKRIDCPLSGLPTPLIVSASS